MNELRTQWGSSWAQLGPSGREFRAAASSSDKRPSGREQSWWGRVGGSHQKLGQVPESAVWVTPEALVAQERGRSLSRQGLTHAPHSQCVHRWPAHGWWGCSAREWGGVMGSLSHRHREEGDSVDGRGWEITLTWVSSAKESNRILMPSHEVGPSRTEPTWPLSRVYHTACGSPAAQSPGGPSGQQDLRLTTHLPASPPLPGPGWGHSPRHGLPGALAQSPASAPPPPRQRRGQGPCSTRRHCGSAWTGPAALLPGPAWHLQTRAAQAWGPTVPASPIIVSLAWAGTGEQGKGGNIKACQ